MSNKAFIKKVVRKGVGVTKVAIKSNRVTHRVARGIKSIIFGIVPQNIYDFHKYYPSIVEYSQQIKSNEHFNSKPLISILMPTYNTPLKYLEECIESVLVQSYPHWELCIADDASPDPMVVSTIKKYAKQDERIRLTVRKKNGHISAATNTALDMAHGEFVALLDHDDLLWPNALYELVKVINENPKVDLIYTDEDKVNAKGTIHSYPFLKPDWSPEFLESCNYITHFACIRSELMRSIKGFRVGYEGAQDWDLFLRLTEKTNHIVHIPRILYSWRVHEASTAFNTDAKPYVYSAQRKLLEDHVARSGRKGVIKQGIIKQHCSIEYEVEKMPKVSILLYATGVGGLRESFASIKKYTKYTNYDITLLADPMSTRLTMYCKHLAKQENNLVHYYTPKAGERTRETLYDAASKQADGTYLVIMNTTSAVSSWSKNWLRLMLSDGQRKGVGMVGGKTVDRKRRTIVQAGIGVGIRKYYATLLDGIAATDIHYMRGLYGQSRRNSGALSDACMVLIRKKDFEKLGGFDETMHEHSMVDLCLRVLENGQRIVYNPFIEAIDIFGKKSEPFNARKHIIDEPERVFREKWEKYIKADPFYNKNFTHKTTHLDLIR